MPLILRIESGPHAGTALPLKEGQALSVGRAVRADFAIAEDSFLSGRHFEVRSDGDTCTLLDLDSSNGTTIGGKRIRQADLRPGDRFRAGQTEFSVVTALAPEPAAKPAPEAASSSAPEPPPAAAPAASAKPLDAVSRERLLKEMRTNLQPLYAVLDAAHDSLILAVLSKYKCEFVSLFHAEQAPALIRFAPYVVALPPASPAIEPLVDLGWGKDWGIYLTSAASGGDLIHFLRRLLISTQPDGQQVLLRFYDPRVLRTMLTNAPQQHWSHFFGPVRSYLVPGEEAGVAVGFAMSERGLERHDISLEGTKPSERKAVVARPLAGSAPDNRLLLSKQQTTELKAQEHDALAERLYSDVQKTHPGRVELLGEAETRKWIKYGCARANTYGIRADADVLNYVSLMMEFGQQFDEDAKLPWASDLLKRRLPAEKKLERLRAAADAHNQTG